MERVISAFQQRSPMMLEKVLNRMIEENLESYRSFPREQLVQMVGGTLSAFQQDLTSNTVRYFAEHWRFVASIRAWQNTRIEDIYRTLVIGEEIILADMLEALQGDAEAREWWYYRAYTLMRSGIEALSIAFIAANSQIIAEQAQRLNETVTPLLPLFPGIVLYPLIGLVDAVRANNIVDEINQGIEETKAHVLITDVTGLPIIEANIANYLLNSMRELQKKKHVQVLIAGVAPETITGNEYVGVNFSDITLVWDLQTAIETIFTAKGLPIPVIPFNDPTEPAS
jgi:anti-anti-sigma regulatory factor